MIVSIWGNNKKWRNNEENKKSTTKSNSDASLNVKFALSGFGDTGAKRTAGAKWAKQTQALSMRSPLSARSTHSKRAYKGPKPTSTAINREPDQGGKHTPTTPKTQSFLMNTS